MAVTGPVFGVIAGGYFFNAIGGYNDPKALPLGVFMTVMAGASGIPIAFTDNFNVVLILLWFQFFFGGFSMPVLTGILLNTAPPSLRTLANSIANLVYNLFGYLPAPFIYGLVYDMTGGEDKKSRWGIVAIESASILSSALLISAYVIKSMTTYKSA